MKNRLVIILAILVSSTVLCTVPVKAWDVNFVPQMVTTKGNHTYLSFKWKIAEADTTAILDTLNLFEQEYNLVIISWRPHFVSSFAYTYNIADERPLQKYILGLWIDHKPK